LFDDLNAVIKERKIAAKKRVKQAINSGTVLGEEVSQFGMQLQRAELRGRAVG
jgi:hypothetical protein